MVENKLSIDIQGFRAINKAQINLNGITVVSGVNGCGKSSISKLLYYTVKGANNYKELIDISLKSKLKDVLKYLDILRGEFFRYPEYFDEFIHSYYDIYDYDIYNYDEFLQYIENIQRKYQSLKQNVDDIYDKLTNDRIKLILEDILGENKSGKSITVLMDMLYQKVEGIFNEAKKTYNDRPINLLKNRLSVLFPGSKLPDDLKVKEYNIPIVDFNVSSVSIPYNITNVIYIDTPMIIGVADSNSNIPPYWRDLNDILSFNNDTIHYSETYGTIKNDIINGDTQFDSDIRRYRYSTNKNSSYDLMECATGIKSFSILQMMLKNGFLDEKTLLIIDEPEVHLHPQWIVEYARIIVKLNIELGVNFFIASHNPDMVSAIKHISKKEGIIDSLNFYIAKETKQDSGCYNYEDIGINIEPIFESFNISLDRIEEYGCYEEE